MIGLIDWISKARFYRSMNRLLRIALLFDVAHYSAASLAPALFLGFPPAFFSTGARNFPV